MEPPDADLSQSALIVAISPTHTPLFDFVVHMDHQRTLIKH
jgi:hypothetical protein